MSHKKCKPQFTWLGRLGWNLGRWAKRGTRHTSMPTLFPQMCQQNGTVRTLLNAEIKYSPIRHKSSSDKWLATTVCCGAAKQNFRG